MNKILIESVTDNSGVVSGDNKKKDVKKYPDVIPVDDAFTFKVGNKMSLSSEKEAESKEIEAEVFDEKYLEKNGVDVKAALEVLGDMEMYNSTMQEFIDGVADKWNKIVEYRNNSDMENYAIQVHSLKSDSKYLGLTSLADVAYQHELKSKENDIDYVNSHFKELEEQYNKTLEIVKKYNCK